MNFLNSLLNRQSVTQNSRHQLEQVGKLNVWALSPASFSGARTAAKLQKVTRSRGVSVGL